MPLDYALTKRKLSIIDRLTARHTYCIWLFSRLIDRRNMDVGGYGEFTKEDMRGISALTKLGAAYVQQCRDQALWMWRGYNAQHQEWERTLGQAKGKWREKLLKREPRKPLSDGLTNKIPVRIDERTGTVEASKRIRLSPYVLRLSSLRKGSRITIPLNPAGYHLELLRKGRVVDFQLVNRDGKYCAHVCIKYDVADEPIRAVRGIDLGVRRATATVLLGVDRPLRQEDFSILNDGEKRHHVHLLNRRASDLQKGRKWDRLKLMRNKRRRVAAHYDRIDAIRIAKMAQEEGSMVVVGYPKNIKHRNFRGNGKRKLRQILQSRFTYGRRIQYIVEECVERGITAEVAFEAWTSKTCHRCESINTRRTGQSLLWCLNCGLQYNADWNSAINIGSAFLPVALGRRATEGLAPTGDELAQKPASSETENVASVKSARKFSDSL